MAFEYRPDRARWAIVATLVLIYFVLYPEDLSALIAPLGRVLELSQSVSPWLYMVLAVGIVAWAIVRVWGGRDVKTNR